MMRTLMCLSMLLVLQPLPVWADQGHHHAVPTLNSGKTEVTLDGDTLTITFGPIDLPVSHAGDLAASMPQHFFHIAEDRYLIGYKSEVFTQAGEQLPNEYLHHILLLDIDQPSISCPGEPLFFAGAGMELRETRLPHGYGVKLDRTHKLMALVAFYHKAAPTKNAMARFTMYLAPRNATLTPLEIYQVGVNVVCFSKFSERPANQTDEGIQINPGVQVMSAPLKFLLDGCVKYAYPHGHDGVLMIGLENKTRQRTLLRTVPNVEQSGDLIEFPDHQIYSDSKGFSVNTRDEYEMVLVHHRPLQQKEEAYGMGNYLLYMTRGECPTRTAAKP